MIEIKSKSSKSWSERAVNWMKGLIWKDEWIKCYDCNGAGLYPEGKVISWESTKKKHELYDSLVINAKEGRSDVVNLIREWIDKTTVGSFEYRYGNKYLGFFVRSTNPNGDADTSEGEINKKQEITFIYNRLLMEDPTIKMSVEDDTYGFDAGWMKYSHGIGSRVYIELPKAWLEDEKKFETAVANGEAMVFREALEGETCRLCLGTRKILRLYKHNADKRKRTIEENAHLEKMQLFYYQKYRGNPWGGFTNEGELPTDGKESDLEV